MMAGATQRRMALGAVNHAFRGARSQSVECYGQTYPFEWVSAVRGFQRTWGSSSRSRLAASNRCNPMGRGSGGVRSIARTDGGMLVYRRLRPSGERKYRSFVEQVAKGPNRLFADLDLNPTRKHHTDGTRIRMFRRPARPLRSNPPCFCECCAHL